MEKNTQNNETKKSFLGTALNIGRLVTDKFRIRGWSELPASLDIKPTAAIVEYPHGLELCNPPEMGWKSNVVPIHGVGLPDRPSGPRAA